MLRPEISFARDLTEEVARAVRLQEGPEGVAQVVRLVGSSGRLTLKELARAVHLPVPVLAAMRRELEARGVLARAGGIKLTKLGQDVLLQLGGPWAPAVCPTCSGTGTIVPERYQGVLHSLQRLWELRPTVDVRLDQSFALPASNLRRCLLALERGALLGKRVLFLGDDDAGSLAVALLARELGSEARITALDVDPRVLGYLRAAAEREGLDVQLLEADAREPLPEAAASAFDTVFTDPPYTLPGLELFLSRALEATGSSTGASIFLSFGGRPPEENVQVLETLSRMGLACTELRPGFNRYEGASVLAGTSDLYSLVVTARAHASVQGRHEGALYTGELRPRARQYVCRQCRTAYTVGPGTEWGTIEALKTAGCPRCGSHSFNQKRERRELEGSL
ncbi:MAG: bis-aminopropyl spermidine synthase family protein [Chloroflexota bacterium]|nr:bis-aminopropyl spermidine synthase family protein [Chloroflexota bacterium]